jgi:hypothetical protein
VLSGVALLGSTTAKTSNHLLGWNIVYVFNAFVSEVLRLCGRLIISVFCQIGYGSMSAIGPETFHGQHRGTGAGLQYTCDRIAAIMVSSAPLARVFFFSLRV